MASILRFLLCLAITTPFAQKDPCITTDKKEIKALEPLRSETELSKASQLYQSLVAAYPNNAEIPYLLGNKISIQYQKIKKDPKKSSEAEKLETQLFLLYSSSYKKCPTFHAEILYTLATMHVARGEKDEALNYLKAYVEFPESDYTKLPVDHAAKKTSAQNFIDAANRTKQFTDNPVPFEPQRIVEVSTELDEYFPMISPDNELMFFTRKVNKKNLGDITDNIVEEFTVAERLSIDSAIFNQGKALLPPFNDGAFFNYGTATLSADNKEMIICACKKEDVHGQKYLNCDLYTTTYKKKEKAQTITNGPRLSIWDPTSTPQMDGRPNLPSPLMEKPYSIQRFVKDLETMISIFRYDKMTEPGLPLDLLMKSIRQEKTKAHFFTKTVKPYTLYLNATNSGPEWEHWISFTSEKPKTDGPNPRI